MTREPLPNRRQSDVRKVVFGGRTYFVGVGYYADGRPGEAFADGAKEGSDMLAVMRDACVLISIALQHGITPAELAKSLGTVPAFTDGNQTEEHASIVGAIVAALEPRPDVASIRGAE